MPLYILLIILGLWLCMSSHRKLGSELDEMWSYVRSKANPRWLWHAIDHHTGTVLAYVFGRRQDTVFLELKALLAPFGITRYFTDGWGAYERHVEVAQHTIGKANTRIYPTNIIFMLYCP